MRKIGNEVMRFLNINPIEDDIEYETNLGIPSPIIPCVTEYFNFKFTVPCEKTR